MLFDKGNHSTSLYLKGSPTIFVLSKEAYDVYKTRGYNVYLVGSGSSTLKEDVNEDGGVDTQDVLKVYDYMKTH